MIRPFAMLLALPLLLTAPAAMAQRADMSPTVAEQFGKLPDTLAGLKLTNGDSTATHRTAMLAYRGADPQDPVIAVVVQPGGTGKGWAGMVEDGRAGARQAGLVDTLFEGKFSLDGHPPGRNFFGDYLTKQGVKQSWIAEADGVRITVLATIYRGEDRRKVFDAIRRDLLGGITMERVSTAEAN